MKMESTLCVSRKFESKLGKLSATALEHFVECEENSLQRVCDDKEEGWAFVIANFE